MIPELLIEFPGTNKVQLCRLLGVSRAELYREPAPENKELLAAIEKIVLTLTGHGYRRTHKELLKKGFEVGEHVVRKTMREHGLLVRRPKAAPDGITKRDPKAEKHENLLRKYEPSRPGEIWAADMSRIRTRSGAVYIAVIQDIFSRKIVAWHLSRSPDLQLALTCLEKAVGKGKPEIGWIHHSDQGSVYTAKAYVSSVRKSGGRMSMSKAATPTDNAYVESFFATLKKEEVRGSDYQSFLEVEGSLHQYIDGTYNPLRMHSALGYLSPDEYEAQAREVGQ
jgi:putative transposase